MKIVYSNPWFSVVQDGRYHFVEEPKSKNAAAVLIRHQNGSFILVEVFRPSLGKTLLEIPRGYAEDGENSSDCARREALEETGYRLSPDQVTRIGSITPNSGILSSCIDIYFGKVEDKDKISDQSEEVKKVSMFTGQEIKRHIVDELITDSFTIGAFMLYELRNELHI
jgi:ADP-ribose pyrophosphatase